jgi:hypothetical protein
VAALLDAMYAAKPKTLKGVQGARLAAACPSPIDFSPVIFHPSTSSRLFL